ncbi:hypothetical protein [Scandinavium goeteborgense]|uniref:hypothetical protein n=1 Tax=Scandinavium goeteborgense TaxID=1851514 RepID=UPI00157440A2|nr:hypothetical protein [Scandinavium goeteborgense]QKN79760.1 hypothetical protein A8O29_000505 [Scandinavium goeteborgense]
MVWQKCSGIRRSYLGMADVNDIDFLAYAYFNEGNSAYIRYATLPQMTCSLSYTSALNVAVYAKGDTVPEPQEAMTLQVHINNYGSTVNVVKYIDAFQLFIIEG